MPGGIFGKNKIQPCQDVKIVDTSLLGLNSDPYTLLGIMLTTEFYFV